MNQGFPLCRYPAKDEICPSGKQKQRSRFLHTTGSAGNDERFIFKLSNKSYWFFQGHPTAGRRMHFVFTGIVFPYSPWVKNPTINCPPDLTWSPVIFFPAIGPGRWVFPCRKIQVSISLDSTDSCMFCAWLITDSTISKSGGKEWGEGSTLGDGINPWRWHFFPIYKHRCP